MSIQKSLHVSLLAGIVALASAAGTGANRLFFEPSGSGTVYPDPGTLSETFARTSEQAAPRSCRSRSSRSAAAAACR